MTRIACVILAVAFVAGLQEPRSPAAREAERQAARARVDALIATMKKVTPASAAVAAELREIREKDQRLRVEGMRLWNEKGTEAPEAVAVWKTQAALDAENQTRLEEIIARHGWPGVRLAGLQGADAAFLVVDHGPHAFQKKYLPLLQKATAAGDAPPMWAANLEDRVRMGDKLPQRYGTQVHREAGWKEWRLWPIEDESRVDDRRAAVGLEPLAEYLKFFGITYKLKTESSYAAQQKTPGHSIGQVSTNGDLIVVELDRAALGQPNLFDLVGRTLRFSPAGSRYRVTTQKLRWEADYGVELTGSDVSLRRFTFPFSGQRWSSFSVGTTGSIRFGAPPSVGEVDPYGQRDGGIASAIGRFDRLADVGGRLGALAPAICVFLKPRMSGQHYVRESADRVVITWQLTEPFGGLLDFSWFSTTNVFQAVLHRDGAIEMSYQTMAAKDGIVGVYPMLSTGESVQSVHLSGLTSTSAPFAAVYESFHYLQPPRPQDLACTVIQALGDKFDFLAYYSDFRIDSQEASSPSDGPIGGNVTGIGDTKQAQTKPILESRCTGGRFQLGFAQPIFVEANEMQEGPPDNAPVGNPKHIAFHTRRLAQAAADGKPRPYNYAVGHLGHEIGHRWSAYAAARVNGQTVSLGAWPHWDPGLHAPVAYPYSLPVEASTQGGGVWQDNLDGTFTQLRDGYFVPATGYSYLELYLMGLIAAAEVPDFFIVRPLVRTGTDANGRPIFKGQRMRITIQDVIAAEGPRLPDVDHSQRHFNTGIVVIVEHGRTPSAELINRANGIRRQWIDYWAITTGRRASMTVSPH